MESPVMAATISSVEKVELWCHKRLSSTCVHLTFSPAKSWKPAFISPSLLPRAGSGWWIGQSQNSPHDIHSWPPLLDGSITGAKSCWGVHSQTTPILQTSVHWENFLGSLRNSFSFHFFIYNEATVLICVFLSTSSIYLTVDHYASDFLRWFVRLSKLVCVCCKGEQRKRRTEKITWIF